MRDEYPFIVDIQSDLLSNLATRMVVPLAVSQLLPAELPHRLCPIFVVRDQSVMLQAFEAAPLPRQLLKTKVASLKDRADEIIAAMDAVLSGI